MHIENLKSILYTTLPTLILIHIDGSSYHGRSIHDGFSNSTQICKHAWLRVGSCAIACHEACRTGRTRSLARFKSGKPPLLGSIPSETPVILQLRELRAQDSPAR